MSLKFILWQSIFIKDILLLPAFPTHLQCINPHFISFLVYLSRPFPEWKLHKHRNFSVSLVHYRWWASRTLQNTEQMLSTLAEWMNKWPCHRSILSNVFFFLHAYSWMHNPILCEWSLVLLLPPLQHYHPFIFSARLRINS